MKLSSFHLALITGATSKLGAKLCHHLAEHNISLCITARSDASLSILKEHLSPKTFVETLALDLSKKEDSLKLLAWIKERSPDLVINNAGIGLYGPITSFDLSEQINILTVNAVAPIEITITAANTLMHNNRKGCIVNISSASDLFAFPYFALYAASKGCLTQFSKAFDEELSSTGIRVLTSIPGQIATDFSFHASKGHIKEVSNHSMSTSSAALRIIKQIEKETRSCVFPFSFRLLRWIAQRIPEKLLMKLLKKSIQALI